MPVVRLDRARLSKMAGADKKTVLARLPYLGLDIESVEKGSIRVEYSPNRPDFGSDFGISRALRGILGKETGLPVYPTRPSGITVEVDQRLSGVRPYIACATATGPSLNDEDVRQIIALQEDLHNGLGRRRKKVAIGLHDMGRISAPLKYLAVGPSFAFRPLNAKRESTIRDILSSTPEGKAYGGILGSSKLFPVIQDSAGVVLSFPPVINGDATRVSARTKALFVDVTSTEMEAGDDALAILVTTLAEAGAKIGSVEIRYPKTRNTPDLSPSEIQLDEGLVRRVLGLDLNRKQVVDSLLKARLGVVGRKVRIPRYRVDIIHPVDLSEEVALGYGIDRIEPDYPASKRPGSFNPLEQFLDGVSTIMAGFGMSEFMTYELVDERSVYQRFARESTEKISVLNPRSLEHSILRDSLIPTMMSALSSNAGEEYPQRAYEVGRVYQRRRGGVGEEWHLGCLVAHSGASYSEAKMYLESACRLIAGVEAKTPEALHWAFSPGRSAQVMIDGKKSGWVGEVKPEALASFGLNVPVSGFEINLDWMREQLK